MSQIRKAWKGVITAILVGSLFLSSGCALFLVGAGGAGGYMIRKGEEGDSPQKKDSSRLEEQFPSTEKVGSLVAYASRGDAVDDTQMTRGDRQ